MKLQNKTILVTASTRGIGRACVEACAAGGANVYLAARNSVLAREITDELSSKGADVNYVYHDASKPETFSPMIEAVIKDSGRLDVLINNFGTSSPSVDLDLEHTDFQTFSDIVTVNLRSVFLTSQLAAKYMRAQKGGSIINISSIGGLVPDIAQIAYGTSKAAINYLTKLIAVHEAKNNIRCNAILPGMTATEAVSQNLSGEFRALFLQHIPLGRIGLPEDIASAAVFLASDESSYMTGQLLTVSGGFGLPTPIYGALADKPTKR